jgi:hypothetical protein
MNSKTSPEQLDREVVRHGRVSWLTHPPNGRARIEAQSAAFHALPVSLREGDPVPYEATPGELLAVTDGMLLAANLAEALTGAGTPANEIVVEAAPIFVGPLSDRKLTAIDLDVLGRVPGIGSPAFSDAVATAWRKTLRSIGVREDFPGAVRAELQSSG